MAYSNPNVKKFRIVSTNPTTAAFLMFFIALIKICFFMVDLDMK